MQFARGRSSRLLFFFSFFVLQKTRVRYSEIFRVVLVSTVVNSLVPLVQNSHGYRLVEEQRRLKITPVDRLQASPRVSLRQTRSSSRSGSSSDSPDRSRENISASAPCVHPRICRSFPRIALCFSVSLFLSLSVLRARERDESGRNRELLRNFPKLRNPCRLMATGRFAAARRGGETFACLTLEGGANA